MVRSGVATTMLGPGTGGQGVPSSINGVALAEVPPLVRASGETNGSDPPVPVTGPTGTHVAVAQMAERHLAKVEAAGSIPADDSHCTEP